MIKTQNEIQRMPPEDLQRYVVELRSVKSNDKFFPNAQALLAIAMGLKKFKEPESVEVENTADFDVPVDGKVIAKGQTGKVYAWQLKALRKWLSPVEAAAKLILLFALLALGFMASAQVQTTDVGAPGSYHAYYISGLNGGTNAIGTNTYYTASTITSTTNYLPVVTVSNGLVTITSNTVITSVTNQPGVVSLVNLDLADLFVGAALNFAGAATNLMSYWDYSPDANNWQTNALTLELLLNGTTFVGTNFFLQQFAPGYIRLDQIAPSSANIGVNAFTNLTVIVSGKSSKTGPF
jgi:hypothetical protein